MFKTILFGAAVCCAALAWPLPLPAPAADCPDNPVELGAICWKRSWEEAETLSKSSGKPILILFQEVPGCSNCTRFGASTLSHPLIKEAAEDHFVPLCIYNNKKGKDADVLARFDEPAWNNPVLRIVDPQGKDLVPRMPDFRSRAQLVNGMTAALQAGRQAIPGYLQLLREELSALDSGVDTATFSMYCFWTGEGALGAIPGVVATEPGFQNGQEVVRVIFNPQVLSRSELEQAVRPKGITVCKSNDGFRPDREPKYYLAQTPWRHLPMTTLQACRVNSLVGQQESPEAWLSPRQVALFDRILRRPQQKWPNLIGRKDLAEAWKEVDQ